MKDAVMPAIPAWLNLPADLAEEVAERLARLAERHRQGEPVMIRFIKLDANRRIESEELIQNSVSSLEFP